MESLINIIRENGSGKEEAVEGVSSNIEEACSKDELYELPLETLTDILSHSGQVDYKTARTFLTKAAAKYGQTSVNVLSSLHVDEGLSELELETLLSLIPGIQIFTLLGSFTKKIEVDYEEIIENEKKLRCNLEKELEVRKKDLQFVKNKNERIRWSLGNKIEMKEKSEKYIFYEQKLQEELTKLKETDDSRTEIEQKLNKFNSLNQRNRGNDYFRNELQQEINTKSNGFEEGIVKAKSYVSELQRIVNKSNKMIKTYEKTQKAFSKLQKKFNEIDVKYQEFPRKQRVDAMLIGETNSGKSCLDVVLEGNEFSMQLVTSICLGVRIPNPYNQDKVWIIDSPGICSFRDRVIHILKNAEIVLLCFSKNSRDQFNCLIRDYVETDLLKYKDVILVKTMIDIEEGYVPREEALQLALEKGYKYFEVSAKTGEGINELRECVFEMSSKILHPEENE